MSDKMAISDKMFIHNQVRQDRVDTRKEDRSLGSGVVEGNHDFQTLRKANSFISKYYKEPNNKET